MKAFDLINGICENGLDNSIMLVCEYRDDSDFDTDLVEYFGKHYHIKSKNNNIKYGIKFLVVWSTNNGNPRINGTPDIILESEPTDKIYLYSIE